MSGIIGGAGSKSGVIGTTELDYEEGTFSPVPMAGSTDINSSSTGKYIKIGKLVTITISSVQVRSSNTGIFQIVGGLPFAIVAGYPTACTFRGNDNINLDRVTASVSTTGIYPYYEPHSTSGGLGNLNAENFLGTGSTSFVVQVTYKSA